MPPLCYLPAAASVDSDPLGLGWLLQRRGWISASENLPLSLGLGGHICIWISAWIHTCTWRVLALGISMSFLPSLGGSDRLTALLECQHWPRGSVVPGSCKELWCKTACGCYSMTVAWKGQSLEL